MHVPESVKIIKIKGKGNALVANKDIKKGEAIFKFIGNFLPKKETKNLNYALQIDKDIFLESTGYFDDYLNHSCIPNCYIDFENLNLVSLKDIKKDNELLYDYNTSEYDLIDQGTSFKCQCNSKKCIKEVKGFRYLTRQQKEAILRFASPYIKREFKKEQKNSAI